jgi:hypothetical protein
MSPEIAQRDMLRRGGTSVANGVKRTSENVRPGLTRSRMTYFGNGRFPIFPQSTTIILGLESLIFFGGQVHDRRYVGWIRKPELE